MRLLLAALLLFISASASAAGCAGTGNCYWVGGTGSSSTATHWATTDGGATTGSVPTATDNCNFTANSSTANAAYTFTIGSTTNCLDFVMAGPGGGNKVTWAGSGVLNISGSMNLSGGTAGVTQTFNGGITFNSTTSGKTITSNGIALATAMVFNGIGGVWTLQDTLDIGTNSLSATNGTLDTNGKTVTTGFILHNTAGSTFTLTLGATNWTAGSNCLTWGATGLTLNAGTSTINCNGASVAANLTSGDSYAFNNLSITPATSASTVTLAANQTVNGTLTLTGISPNTRLAVISNTVGTARTITAATVSLTDVDFQDITGSGAATWSGTRVGDRLGNSGITFTTPGTKFWVGGDGSWSNAFSHWATSSGGGAALNNYPLPQDNTKFDALSNATAYTVTVDQVAFMTDLNFSAAPVTGTITWDGSSNMTVQGNYTALSGMTRTYTGAITFAARSAGKTITSNSVTLAANATFNGPSGAWTLQDDFTSSSNILVTNGTLDTNGKTVAAGQLVHNATGTATLTLGASPVNLSSGGCMGFTVTGITLNAGTSTITCSAATAPAFTSGDSYTFNNLAITFLSSSTATFTLGASQTVNGTLTLAGNSATTHPLVQASTAGTATPGAGPYTITANAVSLTDVDFTDITGAGAATWTGTRIGDCKGNSGITFTTGVDKFYVGNTASVNSANVWATSSGGAGATNNFPLCQDTAAKLDAGSFSADGQTLTINNPYRLPAIIASGTDQTYTLAFSSSPSGFYGDVTLDANATISGTNALTMVGRNTQTITSAGKTWSNPLTINSPGGTVKFADAYTSSSASQLILTRGTLDLNGKTITPSSLSSSNSNTRSIKDGIGGGKLVTSIASGTAFTTLVSTGLTVDRTNSWTVEIGGNTATARSAIFGPVAGTGPAWPTVTFTNTTASGQLNLAGGGTLKSLVVSNPPQTLNFTAGTVHKIENTNGFPSGTAGNLVTVKSATAGTPFTLTQVSPGVSENVDYVSVTDSAATPASTWCAGVNSTNGGGNTGWTFNSSACTGATSNTGNFSVFF